MEHNHHPHTETQRYIAQTTLRAGRLLMESGAETARVENTMGYIMRTALQSEKEQDFELYVLLNALFVRIGTFQTSFQQVESRGNNLGRIHSVNQVSRDFSHGKISLKETHDQLVEIENNKFKPLAFYHIAAAALLSGSVVFLYSGGLLDFFPALLSGMISYIVYHLVSKVLDIPFASEFIGTLCGGLVAYFLSSVFHTNFDIITIGAVIPLVPGIALTNATRDIMDRHYVTGVIRFVECLCIGIALGGGIAVIYYLLS